MDGPDESQKKRPTKVGRLEVGRLEVGDYVSV